MQSHLENHKLESEMCISKPRQTEPVTVYLICERMYRENRLVTMLAQVTKLYIHCLVAGGPPGPNQGRAHNPRLTPERGGEELAQNPELSTTQQ